MKIDKEIQDQLYDLGWNAGRTNTLWNRVVKHRRGRDTVRGHLRRTYDPKKLGKMSWKSFVKAHSHWKTPKGLLDLRKIAAHWKDYKAGKAYDPTPKKHSTTRPPSRWFTAMLQGIRKRSDVRNPAAIVTSIWKRLSPSKRAQIKATAEKGGTFHYDLPLPDDRPTRGPGTVRMVKPFKLAEVQVNLSVKDYLAALKSGLFAKMKRQDGSTALVARCKSDKKNCNIFIDKA